MPEPEICPDCDGVIDPNEEEIYRRADMIDAAINDIENPWIEMALLTMFAGRFLAAVPAEYRKRWRRDFIRAMDDSTKIDVSLRAMPSPTWNTDHAGLPR